MISRAIWSCPPQSWPDVLVCVTLYALTLPLLMVLFRKYGPTIYNPNTAPGLWRVIWLIPAANTLIILIFTNDFDPTRANDPLSLIVRFLALVSSLVIFFLLLGSLKNWIRQSILEEQIQHGQQILALQREQYARLREYAQETRQACHDLRQHLRLIQGYLATGDREALGNYIREYDMSLPADPVKPYCKNFAVDTLFRYYGEKCQNPALFLKPTWIFRKPFPYRNQIFAFSLATFWKTPWNLMRNRDPAVSRTRCRNPIGQKHRRPIPGHCRLSLGKWNILCLGSFGISPATLNAPHQVETKNARGDHSPSGAEYMRFHFTAGRSTSDLKTWRIFYNFPGN